MAIEAGSTGSCAAGMKGKEGNEKKRRIRDARMRIVAVAGPLVTIRSGYVCRGNLETVLGDGECERRRGGYDRVGGPSLGGKRGR